MTKFIGDIHTADFAGPNWFGTIQNAWKGFSEGVRGTKAATTVAKAASPIRGTLNTSRPPTVFPTNGSRPSATYNPGQVNTTLLPTNPQPLNQIQAQPQPVRQVQQPRSTANIPAGARPAANAQTPNVPLPQPLPPLQDLKRRPVPPGVQPATAVGPGGAVELPEEFDLPEGVEPGFWASLTPMQKGLIYGGGGIAGATALGLNPFAQQRQPQY